MFLEDYSSDFANFADDTTLYECGPTLNEVMNSLETTTGKMFEWLSFNNLKANASKCQHLATELFKVTNDLSPEIMKENSVFQQNETYNLRSGNHLARKNIRTTQYGIESVSNLGGKSWNLLPREIKNSSSLTVFKNKIRKWTPEKCPCKLFQTYIKNVGYI